MNVAAWRAGHLPGIDAAEVRWHTLPFAAHGRELQVEVPILTAPQMLAVTRTVRQAARERLQAMPVDEIIEVLGAVVTRLLEPTDPRRRELDDLLPVVTGFDPEMVQLGLTACLQGFRAPQLRRFVAQDFSNPKILDGFQPALKGGAVRAFGPSLLAHVWAGNVPGLPLWSMACGLLVKAGNIGKLPSAEPVFASVVARLIAELHPPLADALAVVWWQGGGVPGVDAILFRESETVLAYGGDAALQALRERVPVTTRFLPYGHKLGVALVGRAALDRLHGPASARLAARDVARYEQQGCYSPHVVYVERGGEVSPRAFSHYLAAELANLQHRHPARVLTLDEAAAVARWHQAAEWNESLELIGNDRCGWTVVFSDVLEPLAPTPGQRCVLVSAADALDRVVPLLASHAPVLQTVGLATTPELLYGLAERLGQAGVTRIAPLGSMTQPEPGWHHDGRFSLADLVRMVEIDAATERAADRLAPYAQEEPR
ncbi:MAG: acyl-CoA reductase [Janthinobacterium lividum]